MSSSLYESFHSQAEMLMFNQKYNVYNKHYFIEFLEYAIKLSRRYNDDGYLLLVNCFDKASQIANIINNTVRESDVVGLVDRTTFGVIFSRVDSSKLDLSVNRLAKKLSDFAADVRMGGVSFHFSAHGAFDAIIRARKSLTESENTRDNSIPFVDYSSIATKNSFICPSVDDMPPYALAIQPIINSVSKEVIFQEILLRLWNPEDDTLNSPYHFIRHAERHNFCHVIDGEVLKSSAPLVKNGSHSINVSISTLSQHNLPAIIDKYIAKQNNLIIEVTETLPAQQDTLKQIQHIKSMGCKIAIDDFGCGYTNERYIEQWPIDFLKLDRGFVQNCFIEPDVKGRIMSIVEKCEDNGITVIAEGVETEEQAKYLQEVLNIHNHQGYFYGRPSVVDMAMHVEDQMR
jgi:EAL domain-containing protein (putative c-di-GMP-specific phosphodiesterase class I)